MKDQDHLDQSNKKKMSEIALFLAVFFAPISSIIIVGGYGFMVWIYQIILRPPTS